MDKKEAQSRAREWMSSVAEKTGWQLSGLTLWSQADLLRVGVRLRPSTFGTLYFIDCLVFMAASTRITSTDVMTICFPISTIGVIDAQLHESVDFSQHVSDIAVKRKEKVFISSMCDDVLPRMARFMDRTFLDPWIRQNPYYLTAALRSVLGVKAPHD